MSTQDVSDSDAQLAALDRGELGANPQAQTLMRSSSDPAAVATGEQMQNDSDQAAWRNQQSRQQQEAAQQREADKQAKEAQRQQDKADKEAQRQQDTQDAARVKIATAQGADTDIDPITGHKTIKTDAQGNTVYKPGPVGHPVQAPILDRAAASASILGQGDTESGAQTTGGGTVTPQWVQNYRNAKGETKAFPLPTKTDKTTGAKTVKHKNDFGATVTDSAGYDPDIVAANKERQAIDLETVNHQAQALNIKTAKDNFDPKFKPVENEFEDAGDELSKLGGDYQRTPSGGWVKIDPHTKKHTFVTASEAADHAERLKSAKERYAAAEAKYNRMLPAKQQIEAADRKNKEKGLQLQTRRTALKYGLRYKDLTLARALGEHDSAEAGIDTPTNYASDSDSSVPTQPTRDHVSGLLQAVADATREDNPQAAPLDGPPKKTAEQIQKSLLESVKATSAEATPEGALTFAKNALGGVLSPEDLTIGKKGRYGFNLEYKGKPVGRVYTEDADKLGAYIKVRPEFANLASTSGVPVYIEGEPDTFYSPAMCAKLAKQAMEILTAPTVEGDPSDTPAARMAKLKELHLDYASLVYMSKSGAMPVQFAESMANNIWNASIKQEAENVPLGERFKSMLVDRNLFASFSTAASNAWNKTIWQDANGTWNTPVLKTQGNGIINAMQMGQASALQIAGARSNSESEAEKTAINDAITDFQRINNLTAEQVKAAWSDASNLVRKWEPKELIRQQSDGRLVISPIASECLEKSKLVAAINAAPTSEAIKNQVLGSIDQIAQSVAFNKYSAYRFADLFREKIDDFAKRKGFTDITGDWNAAQDSKNLVPLVKAYEKEVIGSENAAFTACKIVADKTMQGFLEVDTQVVGSAALVTGNKTAAKLASDFASLNEALQAGSPNAGTTGELIKFIPQLASQVLLTRGVGAVGAAAGLGEAALTRAAFVTNLSVLGGQMGGGEFASAYDRALAEGKSEDEAMRIARTKGAVAGVNAAAFSGLFGVIGSGKFNPRMDLALAGIRKNIGEVTIRDLYQVAKAKGVKNLLTSAPMRSFVSDLAKASGGTFGEMSSMSISNAFLNADPNQNLADAWSGAIGSGYFAVVLGALMHGAKGTFDNGPKGRAEAAKQFMDTYNASMKDVEGFRPIELHEAMVAHALFYSKDIAGMFEAARATADVANRARLELQGIEATMNAHEFLSDQVSQLDFRVQELDEAIQSLTSEGKIDEAEALIEQRNQAKADADAIEANFQKIASSYPDAMARYVEAAKQAGDIDAQFGQHTRALVEALNEIEALQDPSKAMFYHGLIKLATGNAALISPLEMSYLERAKTADGKKFYDNISGKLVVSKEGMSALEKFMPKTSLVIGRSPASASVDVNAAVAAATDNPPVQAGKESSKESSKESGKESGKESSGVSMSPALKTKLQAWQGGDRSVKFSADDVAEMTPEIADVLGIKATAESAPKKTEAADKQQPAPAKESDKEADKKAAVYTVKHVGGGLSQVLDGDGVVLWTGRTADANAEREAIIKQALAPMAIAQRGIKSFEDLYPALKGKINLVDGTLDDAAPAMAYMGGRIVLSLAKIEDEIANLSPSAKAARVRGILDEELKHLAQFAWARNFADDVAKTPEKAQFFIDSWLRDLDGEQLENAKKLDQRDQLNEAVFHRLYTDLWQSFTPEEQAAIIATYDGRKVDDPSYKKGTLASAPDAVKAAEGVRMVLQLKLGDVKVGGKAGTTESTKTLMDHVSDRVKEIIEAAVDFLRGIVQSGKASKEITNHLHELEDILQGWRSVAGKRSEAESNSVASKAVGEGAIIPAGTNATLVTPNNERKISVVQTVVGLDQLVGSDDPRFPGGALQPRDRSTAASKAQREEMVANIRNNPDQYRRYIDGVTTDTGRLLVAPLFENGKHAVNANGKPLFYVISGNGRRNAIAEAERRGQASAFFKGVHSELNREIAPGVVNPVPVSIYEPESAKDAIGLAELSNRDAQLSVTNTEQAVRDARSVEDSNLLKLWEPDDSGNPAAASNRGFVQAFARSVGDEGILAKDGSLTEEGAKRIERAMFAAILGPERAGLIEQIFNRADALGLRNVIAGIGSEAGNLLRLAIEKPDYDLTPVLADALTLAVEAKTAVANGTAKTPADYFSQGDLFGSNEATPERQLAQAIAGSRSRKAVREILEHYRNSVDAIDTSTMDMFGDVASRGDLVARALDARPFPMILAEVQAEFGQGSALAQKLSKGLDTLKNMDPNTRREMAAAVAYEVDRLREGIPSAATYQAGFEGGVLDSRAAFFQRWLDSHTPESIDWNRIGELAKERGLGASGVDSESGKRSFEEQKTDILKVAPRGGDGHPLALNGKRSNLTEDQWAVVRTDNFKRWFGDWERLDQKSFLNGPPVLLLTGSEFQKNEGESLIDRVAGWFESACGGKAHNPELGEVILDRRGVKDSWSHGPGRFKAAAFAAVPDVIRNGKIIDRQKNWKDRGYDTAVIAAPIKLGDESRIVAVVVEQRSENRFYLHEAYIKENLQNGLLFKTGTSQQSGAKSGDIESLLHGIYSVNPETVSKVVDENGEPRIAYHGTRSKGFDTFKNGDIGFHFGLSIDQVFGETSRFSNTPSDQVRLIEAYLNVRNALGLYDRGYWNGPSTIKEINEKIGSDLSENASIQDIRDAIQRAGYDGIAYENLHEGDEGGRALIVLHPNQIKSATANDGEFSDRGTMLGASGIDMLGDEFYGDLFGRSGEWKKRAEQAASKATTAKAHQNIAKEIARRDGMDDLFSEKLAEHLASIPAAEKRTTNPLDKEGDDLGARVENAADQTNIFPSAAQKEAGNYAKGKVTIHGMPISIENPRGSERSGTSESGKAWRVDMAHHYGYFLGTEGRDKSHVDMFIGPNPESRKVFIVNQISPSSGKFDEHKVMLGFNTRREAIDGYFANYEPGWKGLGGMVETNVDALRSWLKTENTKRPARPDDFGNGGKDHIGDFGEKIGGARKDMEIRKGGSTAKPKSDNPGWFNRYEVGEIVSELKPTTSLERYFAGSPGSRLVGGNVGRFSIRDLRKKDWRGQPVEATNLTFATREEAEAHIPLIEVKRNHLVRSERVEGADKEYRYGIWRRVTDRKSAQVVKETFPTREEAEAYMAKHAREIIETKKSWREELFKRPEKVVRSGIDRRTGPATKEMFESTFGFRGVEFGNWMRQEGSGKERQEVLNYAYDGLLDLADVLGVHPKALSLNGELALAFGARGQGLQGAVAHYERDYAVINLTKMSGAGSLAHEWFHALDHYLGRQDGKAGSEMIRNSDGDLVFKAKGRENDYVSHGFGRNSKVREAVREAYKNVLDTITHKAVEFVEDAQKADSFVKNTRTQLEAKLAEIKGDLARDPWNGQRRGRKIATEAQLAEFDKLASRLIDGSDLNVEHRWNDSKGRSLSGRFTNDTLEAINAIYKAVTNRTGFNSEKTGAMNMLVGYVERYRQRILMLKSAEQADVKTRNVPTSYAMDAKRIDQGGATDYWSTPHELAARAFSAYVEDKVAQNGNSSDFLSFGSDNKYYRLEGVMPFPEGEERAAIDKSFDNLFDVLDTEETTKGVRLYASGDGNEFDNTDGTPHVLRNESLSRLPEAIGNQAKDFRDAGSSVEGKIQGASKSGASSDSGIIEWAKEHGKLIPESYFDSLGKPDSNHTSEHEVWLAGTGDRVIKRTWAGVFGQIPSPEKGSVGRENADLPEYLERMALQDAVFGSDLKFEGITTSDKPSMIIGQPAGQPSAVISQDWIQPKDSSKPHPTLDAIAGFMRDHGFSPAPGSFYGWSRPDGIVVIDAKPDNFINTESGVVPIDLQMAHFTPAEMKAAGLDSSESRLHASPVLDKAAMEDYFESKGYKDEQAATAVRDTQAFFSWDEKGRNVSKYEGKGDDDNRGRGDLRGKTLAEFARAALASDELASHHAKELEVQARDSGKPVSIILHDMISREIPSWNPVGTTVKTPQDIFAANAVFRNPWFESMRIMAVDGEGKVVAARLMSVGSVNETIAHPGDIIGFIEDARKANPGASLILSHNHPGGDPSPSDGDLKLQQRIDEIADIMGIRVIDHIITNGTKGYSLKRGVTFTMPKDSDVDWLAHDRTKMPIVNEPYIGERLGAALRAANPNLSWALYTDTRLQIRGMNIIPSGTSDAARIVLRDMHTEGGHSVFFLLGNDIQNHRFWIDEMRYMMKIASRIVVDCIYKENNGRFASARENGVFDDVAKYNAAPRVADAINESDADARLGGVRVGTVHALNAYRALTAKQAAKGLTPSEAELLGKVESALQEHLQPRATSLGASSSDHSALDESLPYEVVDTHTGKVVWHGTYKDRAIARQVRDRRDIKHGSNRFRAQFSDTPVSKGETGLSVSPSGSDHGEFTEKDAVNEALEKMPPIYRQVFEAISGGATVDQVRRKFSLSEKAVPNILDQIRSRTQSVLVARSPNGLAPKKTADGLLDGGRPDLALSTIPEVAAIDQIRNKSGVPGVRSHDEVNQQAAELLAKDYAGAFEMVLNKARDLQQMTDLEVAAAKMIISRETLEGRTKTAQERVNLAMLIHGYRDIGTETARSLSIRRDPHVTPIERHAQIIAEALFSPDDETRARMRKAPKQDQQQILAGWMQRVDAIKKELFDRGIDIDATLAEFNARKAAQKAQEELAPKTTAVIEQQVARLNPAHRAMIEAVRSGALLSRAALLSGMSVDEARGVYGKFILSVDKTMEEAARKYLAGALGASANPMSEIRLRLGLPDLDMIDDTVTGFVDRRNEKPRKPRAQKPKGDASPKTAPKPRRPGGEQNEDVRGPDISMEEWQRRPLSSWRTQWQTEMAALRPEQRISFEQWSNLPLNREKAGYQRELGLEPVSQTSGTFDLTDPIKMREVVNAFSMARGSKMDMLMEYYKASLVSGPHTLFRIMTSHSASAIWDLVPQRVAEAAVNNILNIFGAGSNKAATFGEFKQMAKYVDRAAMLASRFALESWAMESSGNFEAYAQAMAQSVEFSGMAGEKIPPAIAGKLGKVIRLPFRVISTSEQFIKGFYGQLDVVAQAHRMATSEKLTGDAYHARMEELIQPGSVAWLRALENTKRVSFQTQSVYHGLSKEDRKAQAKQESVLSVLDSIYEGVKDLKDKEWIGPAVKIALPFTLTPLNIAKMFINMAPLLSTTISIFDGVRSLRRRWFRGDLTEMEANAIADKLYDQHRLVTDISRQMIAYMMWYAIRSLLNNDDGTGLPHLTGSMSVRSSQKGARGNAYAVMPPKSFRIGNLMGSYEGLEPFSFVLTSVIDMDNAVNHNGGVNGGALMEYLEKLPDQIKGKTMMQGLSDVIQAVEDPDNKGANYAGRVITGFIPNFVRSPIHESDPYVRDTKAKSSDSFFEHLAKTVGYALAPGSAPVMIDVWGNPIKKNRGAELFNSEIADRIFRLMTPLDLQYDAQPSDIDRYIFNYNMRTGELGQKISINPIPDHTTRNRVKIALSPQEVEEANRNAGQAARAELGEDWDWRNPTDEGAERIKEAFRRAQQAERNRIKAEKSTD